METSSHILEAKPPRHTLGWHLRTWLFYSAWAAILFGFYMVIRVPMVPDSWESVAYPYLSQGYSIIATYGDLNEHWIPHRIYPDVLQCETPGSLVFLDLEGKEVSFFKARVAVCR